MPSTQHLSSRVLKPMLLIALVAVLTALLPGSAAHADDQDAPIIESMSVTPNPVDLNDGAAEVTVRAHVTDDVGVESVEAFLASEQSEQNTLNRETGSPITMERVGGDELDGQYEYTFTMPALSIGGRWFALVDPRDAAGNGTSDFRRFSVLNDDPDVDIPEFEPTFTPSVVDLAGGPVDVTVRVRVTDRAGFREFDRFSVFKPDGHFGDPTVTRLSGDDQDSTWESTFTIPAGARSGQWSVFIGNARDVLNNLGGGTSFPFVVVNGAAGADENGPVVVFESLSPSVVDASDGPVTLTARLRATDPSGVDPDFDLRSFHFDSGPTIDYSTPILVSGDEFDGVYEASIVIDATDPGGSRNAHLPEIRDTLGNATVGSSSQQIQIKDPPLVNETRPTISGLAATGGQLTASGDTWSVADVDRSYRWKRDGTTVSGATSDAYDVTAADEGHQITVVVTAGATGFSPASATSDPTDVAAPPPGSVEEEVTGGETVTTDPEGTGPTEEVPVQTEIVVPDDTAGTISVQPEPVGSPPSGFSFFNQQVDLSGPDAPGPADPYVVTFGLDASLLGSTPPGDVQVFRDGVPVADCTHSSDAVPDPCVADRSAGAGGDALVTVRTTQFSDWNFGVDTSPECTIGDPDATTTQRLRGTAGADVICGGAGNDVINANGGADLVLAGGGADNIRGGVGNDTLNGGAGDDNVRGEHGSDTINGDDGKDNLIGGAGNDSLNGGDGDDNISGVQGTDTIDGGPGTDTCSGESRVNCNP